MKARKLDKEKCEKLIQKSMDTELSPEEKKYLKECLSDPELKQELEIYNKIVEILNNTRYETPEDEIWNNYWSKIYNRLERQIGWILTSISGIILLFYFLVSIFKSLLSSNIAAWLKIVIIAFLLGISILLVSIIREVTTDEIPGRKIKKVLGLVKGNTIRARHLGRDLMAALRNLVGGEITDYTKMLAESREQAIDRMVEQAQALGANAIVGIRFTTSSVMQGAAELLVYGTAVVIE